MEILGTEEEDGAIQVQLDTDNPEPALSVVDAVAEIKEKEVTELATIYDCIGHLVDHIFSNPPADVANVAISFNYEGYNITIHQDGEATFVPRAD